MSSRIFDFGIRLIEGKTKFYISFFNKELTLNLGQPIIFAFIKEFSEYFLNNNMTLKINNLKDGMDKISCEYIDHFMELTKYWENNKLKRKIWSKYDYEKIEEYKTFIKTFKQPFPEIAEFNPFIFSNKYGIADLPKNILDNINGKTIIDIGGYNGDTAYLFHTIFPNSEIRVYEPVSKHIEKIRKILEKDNCNNKILPIQKGLGNKDETVEISFEYTENNAQITTLDKENINNIGLIKMDVEGYESKVIEGAKNTIQTQKPVLIIAIYHTPEDFFEMKDKIKNLNPNYKFMIRRSEAIFPQVDLVLIAY